MIFRVFLNVAVCLLIAVPSAYAQGAPANPPQWKGLQYPADVLQDASGQQTLAEVQMRFERGESKPVVGNPNQPLGGVKTAWFRINLPKVSSQTQAVLTVRHPGMDSVLLYTPAADGAWRVQKSGDSIPVEQWAMPYLHPAFSLDVSPVDDRPVYLAVRNIAPVGVFWQLWDKPTFDKQNLKLHVWIGAYLGIIFLVVISSCMNAFNWRDPIHLVYAIHVAMMGASMLSIAGIQGQYFWPSNAWWTDLSVFVIPALSIGWAALLVYRLVAERGNHWVSGLLISVMVMALSFSVGFLWLARESIFYIFNLHVLYFFVVTIGSLIWFAMRRPRVGLWAVAGFLCLFLGSVLPVLRNLDLLQTWAYTSYAPMLGAALEIPLLLVALYFRSSERRDNLVRLNALSRADPLTGVASQRLLMERLEHLVQRHNRDPQLGAVLRVRLANFKAIQAEGGIEATNTALIRTGACAMFPALESDTVGRYLDRDFVVLLEGKTSQSFVADTAQRIIAKGLTYSINAPGGAGLRLHVACADASMLKEEATTLLARLGSVLDEMANQPAKQLQFLQAHPFDKLPAFAATPPI